MSDNQTHERLPTTLFNAADHLSVEEFLDPTDCDPASEVDPEQQVKAKSLVDLFLACHQINPYKGWNLESLKTVVSNIKDFLGTLKSDTKVSFEIQILLAIMGYGRHGDDGWSITALNRIDDRVRRHFNLKTVYELNPDIKQMVDKASDAKNSPFFKSMNERFGKGLP